MDYPTHTHTQNKSGSIGCDVGQKCGPTPQPLQVLLVARGHLLHFAIPYTCNTHTCIQAGLPVFQQAMCVCALSAPGVSNKERQPFLFNNLPCFVIDRLYNPVQCTQNSHMSHIFVTINIYTMHIWPWSIWLSAKRCTCKGLCTSVENKTLLKTVFI